MSDAAPEPFWIARIAAGQPARLRNPGESAEDYRVAMGWDKPKHTPGLTGQLDYHAPNTSGSEGVAFVIYPAHTSEPLAEVLQREGAEAIAQRLVRCVNTHDELVAALRLSREYVVATTYRKDADNFIREEATRRLALIDAAISKATGSTT